MPGDFDGDGLLTAVDVNMLMHAENSPQYDLNGDFLINNDDLKVWVEDLKRTWFGDANLDGEFNSADFVDVFIAGKYETGQSAGWEHGDWDGTGQFDSGDFVVAFIGGGYEVGQRPAVNAVPEPAGLGLLILGWLSLAAGRRSRR